MTKALPAFIPNSMNKIALVDNKLNDQSIADLFSELAKIPIGPKVIAIVQNFVANETWKSVASFLGSEAATGLTRLIFKDPIYLGNKKPLNINTFSKDLPDCGRQMYRLKELVLQGVGLNKKDLVSISEFATVV